MKAILVLICCLFAPLVYANPSVGADAGRDLENSQAQSLKRDKRLEAEKSHGHRQAHQDSLEHAKEKSLSDSQSERTSLSREQSKSATVEININSILLNEFIYHYELVQPDENMPQAQYIFALCKPITGVYTEYPTLNQCASDGGWLSGRFDQSMRADSGNIAPRRLAEHFGHCGWSSKGSEDFGYMAMPVDPENRYVSQYARCRIAASKWLAQAGQRIGSSQVRSENEVRNVIQQTFAEMDEAQNLWESIMTKTKAIWSRANCAPTLQDYKHFEKPNLRCGVINISDDHITVEGQTTLSAEAIQGYSFKISVSGTDNQSMTAEASHASESRASVAARGSDSRERYAEGRNAASMSRTSEGDSSQKSGLSRKSSAGLSATPKD